MDPVAGAIGCSGQVRAIRFKPGTEKNRLRDDGSVDFFKMFKQDPMTILRPRRPEDVEQEVESKNKITRRGLSYMQYVALAGHSGMDTSYKAAPEVTVLRTTNPFDTIMFIGDSTDPITLAADERPEWDEADGNNDLNIPDRATTTTPGLVGEGKRGISLGYTTDGDTLRRVSVRYPTTAPYREIEYVIYARETQTYVQATGSINITDYTQIAEGDTVVLDDGINPPVTFEFDTDEATTTGNAIVDVQGASSNESFRTAFVNAVNDIEDRLLISAAAGSGGIVNFTHETGGSIGNTVIDITDVTGGMSKGDFSGGSGAELDINQIDNLLIKAIALADSQDCGRTQTQGAIGMRAVLGHAPTAQGSSDRVYVHQSMSFDAAGSGTITDMHKYTGTEDVTSIGKDGWAESSSQADVQREAISARAGHSITKATRQIHMDYFERVARDTIGLDESYMRLVIRITGSGSGNDGDYHIKRIIDARTAEVFEEPAADESGGSLYPYVFYTYGGNRCFDGHVENEGLPEGDPNSGDTGGRVVHGGKWLSVDSAGPHSVARVWATTKNIKGIRIVMAEGGDRDFVPAFFKIQYLNPGGSERPAQDGDWSDVTGHDYLADDQSDEIYAAGQYGYEYIFTSPVACRGIRIGSVTAYDTSRNVEVGQLMAFVEPTGITLSNNRLIISVDGGSNYRTFDIPDVAYSIDFQEHVDAMNAVFIGYQLEAKRSEFGYIWVRGTVAGDNSTMDIDSETNGSNANIELGLTAGVGDTVSATGVTEGILKKCNEAIAFIYRFAQEGDHPKP